jgi:hypothetical protein
MKIIKSIEEAKETIEKFEGKPEDFKLPISDDLQDPVGLNMAIITDSILERGWMPDGFDQKEGYRIYKYTGA